MIVVTAAYIAGMIWLILRYHRLNVLPIKQNRLSYYHFAYDLDYSS